jgi:hypothetical protein
MGNVVIEDEWIFGTAPYMPVPDNDLEWIVRVAVDSSSGASSRANFGIPISAISLVPMARSSSSRLQSCIVMKPLRAILCRPVRFGVSAWEPVKRVQVFIGSM